MRIGLPTIIIIYSKGIFQMNEKSGFVKVEKVEQDNLVTGGNGRYINK